MAFVEVGNNNNGKFWNPKKGESIEGEVSRVKEGTYGKMFLIIEDEDGNTHITTQCASLDYAITNANIEKGDYVKIVYNGRANNKFKSHQYSLFVWEEDEEEE